MMRMFGSLVEFRSEAFRRIIAAAGNRACRSTGTVLELPSGSSEAQTAAQMFAPRLLDFTLRLAGCKVCDDAAAQTGSCSRFCDTILSRFV